MNIKLDIGDLIVYKDEFKLITDLKKDIGFRNNILDDVIEYVILKSSHSQEQIGRKNLMWSSIVLGELEYGSKIIKL